MALRSPSPIPDTTNRGDFSKKGEEDDAHHVEPSKSHITSDKHLNRLLQIAGITLVVLYGGYVNIMYQMRHGDLLPDPRVKGWLFLDHSEFPLCASTVYIILCTIIGPRLMKRREAFQLKGPLIVYNSLQVALSFWMFYEVGMGGWFGTYSYLCQPCDYSNTPNAMRVARVCWWFYFSKLIEYLDTVFFVARKKFDQITILHMVHHSIMPVMMWFGVKHMPGGHITFLGFLNCAVHTVMYLYYLLSAMGPALRPYLWWKKYLTTMQLTQFVMAFLHSFQVLFRDCPGQPKSFPFWISVYAVMFFAMFSNFYKKTYIKGGKPKDAISSNGITADRKLATKNESSNDATTADILLSKFPSNGAITKRVIDNDTLIKTALNS